MGKIFKQRKPHGTLLSAAKNRIESSSFLDFSQIFKSEEPYFRLKNLRTVNYTVKKIGFLLLFSKRSKIFQKFQQI